jgi:hypothetical protein
LGVGVGWPCGHQKSPSTGAFAFGIWPAVVSGHIYVIAAASRCVVLVVFVFIVYSSYL